MEERWATIDGCRMRYLYGGTGPALLLIHGLLGYSFSWRFNLAALAPHASIYAPDLLGVGFSDRCPRLDCSLRAIAERMLRFMDQVGVQQADVLGSSHGGTVTMMMAAAQAQRVRRMILVAPVNPWSRNKHFVIRVLATRAGALAFRAIQPFLTGRYFLHRMYGNPRRAAPGTLEGYTASLKVPGTVEHALRIVRSWRADLRDLESVLPTIATVPTLFMWGSRDRAVPPESAAKLAANFADAKLVMLDGAGHLPYEEVPADFNRIVVGYLVSDHRAIG